MPQFSLTIPLHPDVSHTLRDSSELKAKRDKKEPARGREKSMKNLVRGWWAIFVSLGVLPVLALTATSKPIAITPSSNTTAVTPLRTSTPSPSASATSTPVIHLDVSAQNLRDLYATAAASQTQVDEVKTVGQWLVGIIGVIITLGVGGGAIYVTSRANKAGEDAQKAALDQVAAAQKAALDAVAATQKAALDQVADLRKEVESSLQISRSDLDFALAQQRYSAAHISWRYEDFSRAIALATQALAEADTSIAVLKALSAPSDQERERLAARQRYRCHIVADLAYYLAERFAQEKNAQDAERALAHIRNVLYEWSIFGSDPPLNLIDNYLFVLWTVGDSLASRNDHEQGRLLLMNYEDALRGFLQREDKKLLARIYRLLRVFPSHSNHQVIGPKRMSF